MKKISKKLLALFVALLLIIAPLSVKQLFSAEGGSTDKAPEYNASEHTDITDKFVVEKSGSSVGYLPPANWANGYTVTNSSKVMPNERIVFSNIYASMEGTVYFSAKLNGDLVSGGNNPDWSGPVIHLGKVKHETNGEGYLTALFTKTHGADIRIMDGYNNQIDYLGLNGNYPDTNSPVRSATGYTVTAAVSKDGVTIFINGVKWVDNFDFEAQGYVLKNFEFAIGFVCCAGSVNNIRAWCENKDYREPDRTPYYKDDNHTDLNPFLLIGTEGTGITVEKDNGIFNVSASGTGCADFGNITGIITDKVIYTANFKKGIVASGADENAGPVMHIGKAQYGSKIGTLALILTAKDGIRLTLLDKDNSVIAVLSELEYGTNKGKDRKDIDYSVTAVVGYKNISVYVNTYTMLNEHSVNGLGITLLGHEFKISFANVSGKVENIRAFCDKETNIEPINVSTRVDVTKTEISDGTSSETPLNFAASYAADSGSNTTDVILNANVKDLLIDGATVITKTVFATGSDYPTANGLQLVRLGKVKYNGTEYFADLHLTKTDGMKVVLVELNNTVTDIVITNADYVKADGTTTKTRFDLQGDLTVLATTNNAGISIYMNGYRFINKAFDNELSFVSADVGAGVRNMKTYTTGFVKRYNTGVKAFSVLCFKADRYSTAPVYNSSTDTNLNANTETGTSGSGISVIDQVNNNGYYQAQSTSDSADSSKVEFFDYNIKADGTLYFSTTFKKGITAGDTNIELAGPVLQLGKVEKDGQEGMLAVRFTASKYIELFIDGTNAIDLDVKCEYPDTRTANRGNNAYDVTVEVNSEYISLWVEGEQLITRYSFADNGITFKSLYSAVKFVNTKAVADKILLWCKNADATAVVGAPTFNPATDHDLTQEMVTYSQAGVAVTGGANDGYSYDCTVEDKNIKFSKFYVKPGGGYITNFVIRAGNESSQTWGGHEIVIATIDVDGHEGYFSIRFFESGGISAQVFSYAYNTWVDFATYPDTKTHNRNKDIDYNVTISSINNTLNVWVNGKKVIRDVTIEGLWDGRKVTVTENILKIMMNKTTGAVSNIKAWTPKENYQKPAGAPEFNPSKHINLTTDLNTPLIAGASNDLQPDGTYDISLNSKNKILEYGNLQIDNNATLYTKAVIKAGITGDLNWSGPNIYVADVSNGKKSYAFGIRLMKRGGICVCTTDFVAEESTIFYNYPESDTSFRNDNIDYELVIISNLNEVSLWVNDVLVVDKYKYDFVKDDNKFVTEHNLKIFNTSCNMKIEDYQVWCAKEDFVKTSNAKSPTPSLYAASGVPKKPEGNINYADRLKSGHFATMQAKGFSWDEKTNTLKSTKKDQFGRVQVGNFTDMSVSDTFAIKFKYTVTDYEPNGEDKGAMGLRFYFRGFTYYGATNNLDNRGIMFANFGASDWEYWNWEHTMSNIYDYGFEVGKTYDVEILSGPSELGLWMNGKKIFYLYNLPDCGPYFTFEVYRSQFEMANLEIYNIEPEEYDDDEMKVLTPLNTDLSKIENHNFDNAVDKEEASLAEKNVVVVSFAVIVVAFIIFTVFLFKGNKKKGGKLYEK